MKRLNELIRLMCFVVIFVSRIYIFLINIIIIIIEGREKKKCKFVN